MGSLDEALIRITALASLRVSGHTLIQMPFRRSPRFVVDADRLAELFDAYAGEMTGYFARRVGSPEVAVDLTAETFAQAFAARKSFRGTVEDEAVGWLYGIGRHLLAHHLRDGAIDRRALERLGIRRPIMTDEDLERVLEFAGREALLRSASDALGALPEEQREAVSLRVIDELEYGQVAERLGVSQQTARSRVSRGLRRLAVVLAAQEPSDG